MVFNAIGKVFGAIEKIDYTNSLIKIEDIEKNINSYSDDEILSKMKRMPISVSYEIYSTSKLYHPRIIKCIRKVYVQQLAGDLWRSNERTPQEIVNKFKQHPKEILRLAVASYKNEQFISHSENVKKAVDYLLNN